MRERLARSSEVGRVLEGVRKFWERFEEFNKLRVPLDVSGLGKGEIAFSGSGFWLRPNDESGWNLVPWEVVLGRVMRDSWGDSWLVKRPWKEGLVAAERGEDGKIEEVRLTTVEEVIRMLLERRGGLKVMGKLRVKPDGNFNFDQGRLLTINGGLVTDPEMGMVYLLILRGFNPRRVNFNKIEDWTIPVRLLGRRELGRLFREENLDVGGEKNWFNRESRGREKKRRRKRRRR